MLVDHDAIEAAVNATFPNGLPSGHTIGVVGMVDNHGIEGVGMVRVAGDALKLEGYYQHPWGAKWGSGDKYGGALLFSK